jgi:flagellar biosynthesis protein FliR
MSEFAPSLEVFARSLGMLAIIPLSFDLFSIFLRIAFSLLVAISLNGYAPFSPESSWGVLAGNFIAGVALGLPSALLVHGAEWFGETFDSARGQSIGSVIDPFHQSSTAMAQLCGSAGWAIVLLGGFVPNSLIALAESFRVLPITENILMNSAGLGQNIFHLLAIFLDGAARVALPLATLFVMIEFLCGVLAKLVPGASLASESFQLKFWIGFLVVAGCAELEFFNSLGRLAGPFPALLLRP